VEENKEDMFSPTSAAALALSTLHHFGAQRDNRAPSSAIRGTRLFNSGSNNTAAASGTSSSWSRSTSPSPNFPSHSFDYASVGYNVHDHSIDHSHSNPNWGVPATNLQAAYPPRFQYNQAQTDSNPSSTRASPTISNPEYYPDEQHSTTYHNHVSH
jgi:hypothetical protein